MFSTAQQKRNLERLEREEEFKKFKIKINEQNFGSLNSFKNLFLYHFTKNDIPFINQQNYYSNSTRFTDFRSGIFFQNIILTEIKKNQFKNYIFYNLYFDSTNLSKNKLKKKNIFNTYIQFNNDLIKKDLNKKFIYNLSSISENKLKIIGINNYLFWLCTKLKEEVQDGIYFVEKNKFVKSILLYVLGDNKEIYELLGLKLNFGKGNFKCRCCDINSKDLNDNEKNTILNNDNYFHFIKMVKYNINNHIFFNIRIPPQKSNLFILEVFFFFFFC
jgi:hypothetical protein